MGRGEIDRGKGKRSEWASSIFIKMCFKYPHYFCKSGKEGFFEEEKKGSIESVTYMRVGGTVTKQP